MSSKLINVSAVKRSVWSRGRWITPEYLEFLNRAVARQLDRDCSTQRGRKKLNGADAAALRAWDQAEKLTR